MIDVLMIDKVAANIGRALTLSQPDAISPGWQGLATLPPPTQDLCRRVALQLLLELDAQMLLGAALGKLDDSPLSL
jgi:hypothetical protein